LRGDIARVEQGLILEWDPGIYLNMGINIKERGMRKIIIWIVVGMVMLTGCRSYFSYDRNSTSDIPFHKRKPPNMDKVIIISTNGPQLEPKYYEIMGNVMSQIDNITIFQNHCKDAIEMLRYEAGNVGADALIGVSCSPDKYSAEALGTAITFRNREQALKVLKDMKAILE
jgi:uncharacterized protein YbjQ (UPF0145 family)